MSKLAFALAAALVLVPSAGFAASAKPAAAPAQMIDNFWVDIYGGERLANTLLWNGGSYDLSAGQTFGATFGMGLGNGLAIDADVMEVNSCYIGGCPSDVLNSTSFMADIDYTAWLSDSFGIYGGAGLGFIRLNYDNSDYGTGAGGQVKAGVIAKLSDNVSIFGEAKFQEAFGTVQTGPDQIQDANTSILAGLRFGMH